MDSHSGPSPRLGQDSHIAIVGGGPAGSFFALAAYHLAEPLGLKLQITIFERKDLAAAGPLGCNMCAGILSRRVIAGLAQLDIAVPQNVILGRVRRYMLHWGERSIPIDPPDATRQVLSIYRGGGPRHSPYKATPGLDDFLLRQAQARGARVLHERVEELALDGKVMVKTPLRQEEFDLVVLAIGVNATPPRMRGLSYSRPTTEVMAQDDLLIERDSNRTERESTVHIYFDQPEGLFFGALVPKGAFTTVSLLGSGLSRTSIQRFIHSPQVQNVVGNRTPQMCGCRPHVAVGPARGTFANRFVCVGDSSVTRLYKDGIGSALVTARAAAEVALYHGIGSAAFDAHYAPVCRKIERDNHYGKVVFHLVRVVRSNGFFMRAFSRILRQEQDKDPGSRIVGRTLWALFTGDSDYADILKMMIMPKTLLLLSRAIISTFFEQLARR